MPAIALTSVIVFVGECDEQRDGWRGWDSRFARRTQIESRVEIDVRLRGGHAAGGEMPGSARGDDVFSDRTWITAERKKVARTFR
jgi:hypothetical protein